MERKVYYHNRRFIDPDHQSIETGAICAYVDKMDYQGGLWSAALEITGDNGNMAEIEISVDLEEDEYRKSIVKIATMRNTLNELIEAMIKARTDFNKLNEE